MTPELMKELTGRIEDATKAKNRLDRLREALKAIENGEIEAISFCLQETRVEYRRTGENNWRNVCWADGREPGLTDELFEAVTNILEARINAAEHEYKEA